MFVCKSRVYFGAQQCILTVLPCKVNKKAENCAKSTEINLHPCTSLHYITKPLFTASHVSPCGTSASTCSPPVTKWHFLSPKVPLLHNKMALYRRKVPLFATMWCRTCDIMPPPATLTATLSCRRHRFMRMTPALCPHDTHGMTHRTAHERLSHAQTCTFGIKAVILHEITRSYESETDTYRKDQRQALCQRH